MMIRDNEIISQMFLVFMRNFKDLSLFPTTDVMSGLKCKLHWRPLVNNIKIVTHS